MKAAMLMLICVMMAVGAAPTTAPSDDSGAKIHAIKTGMTIQQAENASGVKVKRVGKKAGVKPGGVLFSNGPWSAEAWLSSNGRISSITFHDPPVQDGIERDKNGMAKIKKGMTYAEVVKLRREPKATSTNSEGEKIALWERLSPVGRGSVYATYTATFKDDILISFTAEGVGVGAGAE